MGMDYRHFYVHNLRTGSLTCSFYRKLEPGSAALKKQVIIGRYISAAKHTGTWWYRDLVVKENAMDTRETHYHGTIPKEAVVLDSAAERMVLRINLHGSPLVLISAHGPHGGKSKEEVAKMVGLTLIHCMANM